MVDRSPDVPYSGPAGRNGWTLTEESPLIPPRLWLWLDSPKRDPRYETLDVWRGVACLMVVLHHSGFALLWGEEGSAAGGLEAWARWACIGFVRQMSLGVPLFFVISGYCIAASLDSHRRRGASPWGFLRRRLRRIYPPYWAALLFFVATTWGLDQVGRHRLHDGGHSLELESPGVLKPAQWLGNFTLTETWRPRVWPGPVSDVYTRIGWSLCYEEQFYLICFLTLLIAPRRVHVVLAGLTGLIVGYRVFAWDAGWLAWTEGIFLNLWHEFAVGLAVYWRLVVVESSRTKRAIEAGLGILLAVGLASGSRSTAMASGFGLALIAFRGLDPAVSRQSWLRPVRACGRRCYSIYLVHLPVCTVANEWLSSLGLVGFWWRVVVMIPLVSLGSVAVSWLFFEVVEKRFLNPPATYRPPGHPSAAGEVAASPAVGRSS